MSRMWKVLLGLIALVAALLGPVPAAAAANVPRIDLRVLVLTDGSAWVEGIRQQLDAEGVPSTVVNLADPTRPAITPDFLSGQLADGTPHVKFDGVVVPGTGVSAEEQTVLADFEAQFGIRQVDAFTFPSPAVGLDAPVFAGSLDGVTATVTPAGLGDAFRYLTGPVTFEDNDPAVDESFGYLAPPLPDDPATASHFEPILTAAAPGSSTQHTLAGIHRTGSRERLVLSFAFNYHQQQFRLLAHGVVGWLTHGIHLGHWRNYLTVHVDDLFSADARWSATGKCTPGEGDCPPGTPDTAPIRMTAADVDRAVAWQQQHGFTLDMLYNAAGSDQLIADTGSDPLTTAMLAAKGEFRWMNHTYTHEFMGCQQDFTVIPWRCATDPATGQPIFPSQAFLDSEIARNIAWAATNGVTIRADELVAGEHSGTKILPQQPDDNPNFVAALTAQNIAWLGMDASREPAQRGVGSALGVPRHPINIFYNVANPDEEVSEYNWIYTSAADGGSGICTANPETTTCIAPLDPATGFTGHIVPEQVQIMLGYVLTNDPRPFYVHQSNLAESGLLYPVLEAALSAYRATFAGSAPVVELTMTDAGRVLQDEAAWAQTRAAGTVTAYRQGGLVTVTGPAGTVVPVTMPAGTVFGPSPAGAFGVAYGGEQSDRRTLNGGNLMLLYPPSATSAPAPQPAPAAPPVVPVPANDLDGAERSVTADAAQASAPQELLVPEPAGPEGGR
jgi:hypothetical protein